MPTPIRMPAAKDDAERRRSRAKAATDESESDWSEQDMEMSEQGLGDEGEEGAVPGPAQPRDVGSAAAVDYKVFTPRYDEIVEASELCPRRRLGRLRTYLDNQLVPPERGHQARQPAVQTAAMAQQSRSWDFDQEEGSARRRPAREGHQSTRPFAFLKVERDTEFRDTVVLSHRQFGMMRGRPISIAAISATYWRARSSVRRKGR